MAMNPVILQIIPRLRVIQLWQYGFVPLQSNTGEVDPDPSWLLGWLDFFLSLDLLLLVPLGKLPLNSEGKSKWKFSFPGNSIVMI